MEPKRTKIDTVDVDGNSIKLAVIRPGNKMTQDANMAYNLRMAKLIREGASDSSKRLLLRAELEDYLLKAGIWTLSDAAEVEKLALEIRASELLLKQGGIKVSEGRLLALEMAEKRQMILERHSKRLQFDSITVESQAENFRFEYLLTQCLVYFDTGKPFLKNHNEYIELQDTEAVMEGARVLANMIYGLGDNVDRNMFEMQWLKNAGMIDSNGKYTNQRGETVDRDGRLINKDGRYIDREGNLIDTFGRPVDDHGNLLVEQSKPFIDDETGNEVVICDIGKKKKTRKRATSKRSQKTKKVKNG